MIITLEQFALTLCFLSSAASLNFTLGLITHRADNYDGAAVSIALDTIRSQGFLLEHNFR